MTLLPTGDKGQRYEVKATGYPVDGETVMGWCDQRSGAEQMAEAFRLAPGCKRTSVRDRWGVEPELIENVEAKDD